MTTYDTLLTTKDIPGERLTQRQKQTTNRLNQYKHTLTTEHELRREQYNKQANTLEPYLVKTALSQPVLEYMMRNCPNVVVLFLGRVCKWIKVCLDLYFQRDGIKKINCCPDSVILGDEGLTLDTRLRLYRDVTPIKTIDDHTFFLKLSNHLIHEEYDAKKVAPYVFDWMLPIYYRCELDHNCCATDERLSYPLVNIASLAQETESIDLIQRVISYFALAHRLAQMPHRLCNMSYLTHVMYFLSPENATKVPSCIGLEAVNEELCIDLTQSFYRESNDE